MRYFKLLLSFLILFVGFSMNGQKGITKQADKYFQAEKYLDALELYNRIPEKDLDKFTLYRKGVSNYHANKLDEALQDFTTARRMGYDQKEIYLYAGKALHGKLLFLEASRFYKNYLRYTEDDEDKNSVIKLIKQCKFGIDNQFNDQIAFVENLGPSVNTEYDETNPVQSPTSQSKYYFSSNRSGSHGGLRNSEGYKDEIYGSYSADMYAIELMGGNWTPASSFHPILNGPKNDLIQGFNPDGTVMYFLKTQDGVTGEMYSDTFSIDKDPEAFPKMLKSPVISELGDKDLKVFNNNTLLFSSKRKGGFGGYDIYVSILKEGEWTTPMNLGSEINSKYDEMSPFLAKSGRKLYFSSNRIESLGGFDIFESVYNREFNKWSNPENLGIPINSALNDSQFSISADGMTAVFSSDRPASIGGSDIYLAYLKDQVTDQLMYTEELPFIFKEEELANGDGKTVDSESSNNSNDTKPVLKEFINSPLYYGKDEIIINPTNQAKMNRIKDLMVIYPELKVTFSGHSVQEGMKEFDLYFSIKRSEKAAEYLIKKGISADRITVKGLGANFPHTLVTGNQINSLAEKNNRRIDIAFTNTPSDRLKIIEERPSVSDGMKNSIFENYSNTIDGLAYKIQVAQTKQMYKADVIRQYATGIVKK